MNSPYVGEIKMLPSFVLYADILGYSAYCQDALAVGKGNLFLKNLHGAFNNAYNKIRKHSSGFNVAVDYFSVRIFTDNIVIGYPLRDLKRDYGEPELGSVLTMVSEFQSELASQGFFLRGGIAYGNHYMDNDIVFGPALVKAYKHDKKGGPPRIVIDPTALMMIKRQTDCYPEPFLSPHYYHLLEDADGAIYLNYLNEAFVHYRDEGVYYELLRAHQNKIINGLDEYKDIPDIRVKYEWLANYHNYMCHKFKFTSDATFSIDDNIDDIFNCDYHRELSALRINI